MMARMILQMSLMKRAVSSPRSQGGHELIWRIKRNATYDAVKGILMRVMGW